MPQARRLRDDAARLPAPRAHGRGPEATALLLRKGYRPGCRPRSPWPTSEQVVLCDGGGVPTTLAAKEVPRLGLRQLRGQPRASSEEARRWWSSTIVRRPAAMRSSCRGPRHDLARRYMLARRGEPSAREQRDMCSPPRWPSRTPLGPPPFGCGGQQQGGTRDASPTAFPCRDGDPPVADDDLRSRFERIRTVKQVSRRPHVSSYRVSTRRQGASGLGLDAQRAAVRAYLGTVGCRSRSSPRSRAAGETTGRGSPRRWPTASGRTPSSASPPFRASPGTSPSSPT